MKEQYRVSSTQIEDIHTGATFAHGEIAVGFDPDDPYDAAKLAEGKIVKVAEPQEPTPGPTDEAVELAAELGIDLGNVAGSGAKGRITKGDVQKAYENQEATQ